MSLSRRTFVKTLGIGAAGAYTSSLISARGREALVWGAEAEAPLLADTAKLILSSNENPMGPGDTVLTAVKNAIGADGRVAGRYPFSTNDDLVDAIAYKFKVKKENVLIGAGSTQILRTVTHVFTSPTRGLVGSLPTYEECAGYAALMGAPVQGVKLDSQLRMDLDQTLAMAKGAGLVFYCNPNNPTATLHPASATRDFLQKLNRTSPETTVLVDEAYHDYVTDPAHETMIPLAVTNPRVVVARTFSKAYGMAGLRIGYAVGHVDTIKKMASWEAGGSISALSYAAAIAGINQDPSFIEKERARNKASRDFTRDFFHKAGYKDSECQTNFLFVDVRMPIQKFQASCREQNVLVGRPFPPLLTYARISLGTMEEMKRATEVFAKVLRENAAAAAA